MKKKFMVPMILALGMQMPLMAMDTDSPSPSTSADRQEAPSWKKVGFITTGTALGSYGLYKGYKWLTYKKPIASPTFFEKLAAQVPGGTAILPVAQKGVELAKKHPYITRALALAAAGVVGYKLVLEPGMRAARADDLKYYINGICDYRFAVKGQNVLGQVCEYVKQLAAEFKDVALIRDVNELINFLNDDARVKNASDWVSTHPGKLVPVEIKNGMILFDQELKAKGIALFKKIDEITK